jgi:hypothetical protein
MNHKVVGRHECHFSELSIVVIMAVTVFGCAQANQNLPSPIGRTEDSDVPAEFARRGLSLLRKTDGTADDNQDDTLKADALIMRAWRLQEDYPDSCLSVWQLTEALADEQDEPTQRLALTSLYLGSVDAAIESAMKPEDFETAWKVRQAVLAAIARHRQDALEVIQANLGEALEALSAPEGVRAFVGSDSAKWSSLSAELNAMIEPLPIPPKSIAELATGLGDKLVAIFDERLAAIRDRLKEQTTNAADIGGSRTDGKGKSDVTPGAEPDRGPVTRLLEDLDALVQMRESASANSWINFAGSLRNPGPSGDDFESGDGQIMAMDELRSKMLDTRVLQYNLWAADAIYNAELRGVDGLFLLGSIETRLLAGAVAASYSITESKMLNEVRDPFNRQVRIREMLSQRKKQLTEF